MKDCKGQNVIEYILLVAAVLLVCIFFLTKGPMSQSVNTSLNSVVQGIHKINGEIRF